MNSYRIDAVGYLIGSFLGLFVSGWWLMLALGILGHPLGYWESLIVAALLNAVLGNPASAIRWDAIKRRHGR